VLREKPVAERTEQPIDIALPKSLKATRIGSIAYLRLARPEKRNALDDVTVLGLETFFTHMPRDIRAIVLTGEGEHFSAGLDLSEVAGKRDPLDAALHSRMWHRAFEAIEFGRAPVIVALQGAVVGGGFELAAAAHISASPNTRPITACRRASAASSSAAADRCASPASSGSRESWT
jgi:enoyl-CoA hydratase/carnithine racemase